jgi:molybdopterin-guanine dinucleotide biosynthesis protein B
VLVEGFKSSDLLKIEIWRAPSEAYPGMAALYPHDDFVVAIATDAPHMLPEPTLREVLDLNDAASVADYLVRYERRFEYEPQLYQS